MYNKCKKNKNKKKTSRSDSILGAVFWIIQQCVDKDSVSVSVCS